MTVHRKGPLETSLFAALKENPATPADRPMAQLALTYARAVDHGEDLNKIGPALLSALEALLMSPRARASALRGAKTNGSPGTGKLDELHARRVRKSGAADLDTATS